MSGNTNSGSPSEPAGSDAEAAFLTGSGDSVDWESRYRSGDTPWDEGFAAPPLTEFLARHPILGRVLVPGAGSGHDVRALAAAGAAVTGLDLSETAVRLARSITATGGETYELGDLFDLPESWNSRFDWVVEHTCFCAIPPRRRDDYTSAITRLLKPGGHYLGIFYLNPAAPQGPPHRTTREEVARLFDPSFTLLEEWLPGHSFEGREGRELCQLWQRKP